MTNSKTGVDVTRWLVAAPDWLDPKWGGPNVEVVPAGAYDQLRAECERLTNKCAALVLVAYGTPENPKTPSVEPSDDSYKAVTKDDRILTQQELKNAWAHMRGPAAAEADIAGHMRALASALNRNGES